MALFIRLGVWQLHRAAEKEQLLRRFATAATAPVRDFGAVAGSAHGYTYPHVRVRGRFLRDRAYYLDEQMHADAVGVQVYVPFRPEGAHRVLLVDMGWLRRHGPGDGAAGVDMPPLPVGTVTLTGLYAPAPGVGLRMGGNALAGQRTWPKTTVYMDFRQVAADLDAPVYPRRLLLDAQPGSAYVRAWKPTFMPPARHEGYAFQWFSFAGASLVIFYLLHRKNRRRPEQQA